jgi:hypothetical protein
MMTHEQFRKLSKDAKPLPESMTREYQWNLLRHVRHGGRWRGTNTQYDMFGQKLVLHTIKPKIIGAGEREHTIIRRIDNAWGIVFHNFSLSTLPTSVAVTGDQHTFNQRVLGARLGFFRSASSEWFGDRDQFLKDMAIIRMADLFEYDAAE